MSHEAFEELAALEAFGAASDEESARLRGHLVSCPPCRKALDELRESASLFARDLDPVPPPERIRSAIQADLPPQTLAARPSARAPHLQPYVLLMPATRKFEGAVPLGLDDDLVASWGDHVAYFWESEAEFARGVRFIERGVLEGDHSVVFGYPEANAKVLEHLRASGVPVETLMREGRLALIGGKETGEATLGGIGETFTRLLESGASRLRLLGNIGWGRTGWPTEADLLAFESRVTGAIADLPCVVMCMYDVQSLHGRVIFHGAMETHPITYCRNVVRENPHYVPAGEFLRTLPDL